MRRSLAVRLLRRTLRLFGLRLPWIALPAGAVIVAPNHQSLLDGPLLACLTDRPLLFGVDPDWCCRQPWRVALALCRWLGIGETVALDTGKPFAWRRLAAALRAGNAVCIFPEGGIARAGELLPIQPGVARLARLADASILPVRIEATRYLLAQRCRGVPRTRISIVASASISAAQPQLDWLLRDALQSNLNQHVTGAAIKRLALD